MQARRELITSVRKMLATLARDVSGITLIECLICSVVVGIAGVGLATMIARGQAFIGGEGDNRVAVYLAQQKIELARSKGFAALTAGPPTTELLSQTMTAVTSNAFYTRTTVVDCVDANDYSSTVDCSTLAKAKRVSVTVQSAPKEARQVTLRAVLADR